MSFEQVIKLCFVQYSSSFCPISITASWQLFIRWRICKCPGLQNESSTFLHKNSTILLRIPTKRLHYLAWCWCSDEIWRKTQVINIHKPIFWLHVNFNVCCCSTSIHPTCFIKDINLTFSNMDPYTFEVLVVFLIFRESQTSRLPWLTAFILRYANLLTTLTPS